MIAQLEIVQGMKLTPQACVLCANNPVDEITGEQQYAIFAPGVDVNWGNSVYICMSCANIIADLIDRSTQEGFDKLKKENEELTEELEELKTQHERAKKLLEKVAEGRKAEKEVKKDKREKVKA